MNVSRREFFSFLGAGTAAAAFSGCCTCSPKGGASRSKLALQLYSINKYIPRVGLDRALEDVAAIGYKGVEFAGYYQYKDDAKGLKRALANAGLVACGTHVANSAYGFDTKQWTFNPDVLKKTCEFNLGYGNNLVICPGGGNFPPGCTWSTGRGGEPCKPSQEIDDFTKKLVEFYNKGAEVAAQCGCRIGLHNHTWEHAIFLQDGTPFWDYFFSNTDAKVCMEQDVGWTTCAGHEPKEQYRKYPHR